jgi:uncharacterized protein YbjT (DUF2867 family)
VTYDFAELTDLDWSWTAADIAERVLGNAEVLCFTSDNGTTMIAQCTTMVAAIKLSRLKVIVKATLNAELSHVPKFRDYPWIETSLKVEAMLSQTGIPCVFVRPAAINENIALWWSDDIRKFGSLVFAPKVCWNWIGAADAAECIVNILHNPLKYAGEEIPLAVESIYYEDMADLFSEATDIKIHFYALETKESAREYLLHDGFSPLFLDTVMLVSMYDKKFTLEEGQASITDWPQRLMGRPAKDFRTWLKENVHYFI